MAKRTCKHPGCNKPHKAFGWCRKHAERWKKYGSPDGCPPEPDLPGENWLAIPGTGGLYTVSDMARVRSYAARGRAGRLLRPSIASHGYLVVSIVINGKRQNAPVHTLVTAAFLGPCPAGEEVRHGDGDRKNALLSNLTYGTHRENVQDMFRHGTAKSQQPHCKRGHEFTPENTRIRIRNGREHRVCLACEKIRMDAWNARQPPTGPRPELKTHCPRGHPYGEENTFINSKGARECRICRRERSKTKAA